MNIKSVIDYLKQKKGYDLSADYYKNVTIWEAWWRGFYKPFHEFAEVNGNQRVTRQLFTLKMAKKVCEDWASILLNEKTQIVIGDKASSDFVQGREDSDGTGGVFGSNGFWQNGNALIEKAFYSGTGAFVVKLKGMALSDDGAVVQDRETGIRIDYLTAMHIIPLTVEQGEITEVAFVSEVLRQGKKYLYLETHTIERGSYVITNEYFSAQNDQMTPEPLPPNVAPKIRTGSLIPLFAIVSPNIVNNIKDHNGLGLSIYADATDNLMGVDLAYNNFCRDFKLGGKKVFYSEALIKTDEKGQAVTPDDVMQQLFYSVGEDTIDENGNNRLVQEFNPSLRVTENKDGVQAQLDYLSFKCGLGTKHYQFNGGQIVTATQYMGDKQELIQNAAKHYIAVESALKRLVKAILWAGKEVLGLPINPDAAVTVNFEDSYVIDKESERLRDLQEIRDGLMQKWEYRVKWKGEDEATAKKMVLQEEADDDLMGFRR